MMVKGFAYPIGSRVYRRKGDTEMLVVDLDPVRSTVVAAWKNGDAVSEAEFHIDTLRSSAALT